MNFRIAARALSFLLLSKRFLVTMATETEVEPELEVLERNGVFGLCAECFQCRPHLVASDEPRFEGALTRWRTAET